MSKMSEIILDSYKSASDDNKILILNSLLEKKKREVVQSLYTELKCQKNQNEITELSVISANALKINKNVFINLSNLTTVNLSDNSLAKISKKFQLLPNLTTLILDSNEIEIIPSFISEIQTLEKISLNNNKIKTIPSSIQNLTNLKVLQLSNNHIMKFPIEIGLLNSLETLFIDNNSFTEIPSTFSYLSKLNHMKLEWFEFIDPPLLKEQTSPHIFSHLKSILSDLIFHSILFCSFSNFVIKLSCGSDSANVSCHSDDTEKNEMNEAPKTMKIFTAIEKDYFGVFTCLIKQNEDLLLIKNTEKRTPLYSVINSNKTRFIDFLLKNVNFSNIPGISVYVHKAIRKRNFHFIYQLYLKGIDLNCVDEKGNNVYHALFSVFNKSIDQCCQLGNLFIMMNVPGMNSLNIDRWSPVHIASRYGGKECLKWMIKVNVQRKKEKKEVFNFNVKGKNNWTPLHLALSSYRYSESVILINLGCDLFSKTSDGKKPRSVTNNYFLNKMVKERETEFFYRKYFKNSSKDKDAEKSDNKILYGNNVNYFSMSNNIDALGSGTDVILGSEASLYEKVNAINLLKFSYSTKKMEVLLIEVIQGLDSKMKEFGFIITEICNVAVELRMRRVAAMLFQCLHEISKEKYYYKMIDNTVRLLNKLRDDDIIKKHERNLSSVNNRSNESDSSLTERNYLMYFEDEDDTIRVDRDFFSEMNRALIGENDKMIPTEPNNKPEGISGQMNDKELDENEVFSDSIIQQDEDTFNNI